MFLLALFKPCLYQYANRFFGFGFSKTDVANFESLHAQKCRITERKKAVMKCQDAPVLLVLFELHNLVTPFINLLK